MLATLKDVLLLLQLQQQEHLLLLLLLLHLQLLLNVYVLSKCVYVLQLSTLSNVIKARLNKIMLFFVGKIHFESKQRYFVFANKEGRSKFKRYRINIQDGVLLLYRFLYAICQLFFLSGIMQVFKKKLNNHTNQY